MEKMFSYFKNAWSKVGQSEFEKNWDLERSRAAKFGPSHVYEIDAIFSRHLEESR